MKQLSEQPTTYTFDLFAGRTDVLVFVTTRVGGSSRGYLGSCNIGFNDDEPGATTIANRQAICQRLGIDFSTMTFQQQVHEATVTAVGSHNAGAGRLSKADALPASDALITIEPGVTLFAQAADCVPIALYDPVAKVAAAVHAGWRGTVQEVARRAVERMTESYGCLPEHILAGIGPSIGRCCYEVGPEVTRLLEPTCSNPASVIFSTGSRQHIDLWEANRQQLLSAGLLPANIEVSGLCTRCCSDRFYSSRNDGGRTGRFGIGITIR